MRQTIDSLRPASRLHHDALVINALDSSNEDKFTAEYVEVLRSGGIDAVNVTVPWPEDDFRRAIASYTRWRRRLSVVGDAVRIVRRAGDIIQAQRDGAVGVILGFQSAKPIEDDRTLVEVFYRLDIRIVQLTYQYRNFIGNGVGERADEGLSKFGLAVIQELNRLGMVVDLSHVGLRTSLDAIEASTTPPIISHTTARAFCQHFRAVPDTLISAVAARGGCVGVAALSMFLRDDGVTVGSTLDDYVRHMEHMIHIAGIDHVGIGFDVGFKRDDHDTVRLETTYPEFKFPPLHLRYTTELNRADKAPNLTTALVERGYGEDDIRKLLGLNWYRVFSQVWGE